MSELTVAGGQGVQVEVDPTAASDTGRAVEWQTPFPYGHMQAIDSAGSVAAPLLAGASFSLIGLILSNTESARLPSVALCLLVLASLALIAAVQCMFWARQWIVTPTEIREWEPTADAKWHHDIQRLHMKGFRLWAKWFRWTYRAGILFLLASIAVVLIPNGAVTAPRLVAIVIASLGCFAEFLWIASGWLLSGSPSGGTWSDVPDEPRPDVSFGTLRRWKLARRLARVMVPLVRVERE